MVNKAWFYPQAPSPPPYSPIIQGYHAAGAMAILEQFGFSDLPEAFKKASFHWPCDLLSLEPILHYKFGRLDLWFEQADQGDLPASLTDHVQQPNRTISACLGNRTSKTSAATLWYQNSRSWRPLVVDFTQNVEGVPPHPRLLALHVTRARVAHMSGAADLF